MAQFFQSLSNVFSTLGAPIFVPAMLFVIALVMGLSANKAFKSALLCAVGLTGFNLVINSYSGVISPVVNQMVKNAGVNLPVMDMGWQSTSVIAYSTNIGLIFIGNIKENENSDLEIYCKKRLRLYLMLNIGIGVVLFEFCEQQVLNVYMETLLLIVISSVLQNRKSFLKD